MPQTIAKPSRTATTVLLAGTGDEPDDADARGLRERSSRIASPLLSGVALVLLLGAGAEGCEPARSTYTLVGDELHDGYRYRQYAFRHPEVHGESLELSVTQRVSVVIPDGVPDEAPLYVVIGSESANGLDQLLAYTKQPREVNLWFIYVMIEHRGYGQSLSDGEDQSVPSYVTTEQAVEDAHAVIEALAAVYPGPRVVLGASYGGSLAFRLGVKHPDDMKVVVSSSGVLRWRSGLTTYEGHIRDHLGQARFDQAAAAIGSLQPAEPFDATWVDREVLEVTMVGLTQYASTQPLLPLVGELLDQQTPQQLAATVRSIDARAGDYGGNRALRQLSRTDALANEGVGWRVYYYQQCSEVGMFMVSALPNGVFRRTLAQQQTECEAMFGADATAELTGVATVWDGRAELGAFGGPGKPALIHVAGGNDPWNDDGPAMPVGAPVEIHSTHELHDTSYGAYIWVPQGFHAPDHDDAAVGLTVLERVNELLLTPSAPSSELTLFGDAPAPSFADSDTAAVALGLRFRSAVDGTISAVRIYREVPVAPQTIVRVFTSDMQGGQLGDGVLTAEQQHTPGWQTVPLAQPIAIEAGRTYIAWYTDPNGRYSYASEGLAEAVTNGPLTAVADGDVDENGVHGNGVYYYGDGEVGPPSSYRATNYFVDVVFHPGT